MALKKTQDTASRDARTIESILAVTGTASQTDDGASPAQGDAQVFNFTIPENDCPTIYTLIIYILGADGLWTEQYTTVFQEGEEAGPYDGQMVAFYIPEEVGTIRYDIVATNACGTVTWNYPEVQIEEPVREVCSVVGDWEVIQVCVDEPPLGGTNYGCTSEYEEVEFAVMIEGVWKFADNGEVGIEQNNGSGTTTYTQIGSTIIFGNSFFDGFNVVTVTFGEGCTSMVIRWTDPSTGAYVEAYYLKQ